MNKQWQCPDCGCTELVASSFREVWACPGNGRVCGMGFGKKTIQALVASSIGQPPKKALGIPYNGGNYQYNPNSGLQCTCGYSGTCYTCLSVAGTVASGQPVGAFSPGQGLPQQPLQPQQQMPQHQSSSLGGLYKASLPPNAAFPCCNQAGGFHVDPLAPCPLIRRFSTSPPGYAMPWEQLQESGPVFVLSEEPKCECGAEKSGSGGHSHWCPKAGK